MIRKGSAKALSTSATFNSSPKLIRLVMMMMMYIRLPLSLRGPSRPCSFNAG
jgi:hypothetical protein